MSEKENPKGRFTTVSIPIPLFKKIEERIKDTEFTSVSSYVTYVLREITTDDDKKSDERFSKEDEEKVKDRLRALGYLD